MYKTIKIAINEDGEIRDPPNKKTEAVKLIKKEIKYEKKQNEIIKYIYEQYRSVAKQGKIEWNK